MSSWLESYTQTRIPCWRSDVNEPGGGAAKYAENIIEGSGAICELGEMVDTEPGLQGAPTIAALEPKLPSLEEEFASGPPPQEREIGPALTSARRAPLSETRMVEGPLSGNQRKMAPLPPLEAPTICTRVM